MNVLHLQLTGNPGGIVTLCRDIANNSTNNNIMYFLFSGGLIADDMKSKGVEVYVANAKRYIWIKSVSNLIAFCKSHDIDVLINHVNSPISVTHVLFVKLFLPNVKVITYLHSAAEDGIGIGRKRYLHMPFVKAIARCSESIIAISEYVKRSYVEALGIDESKIKVVYNGVDCQRFYHEKASTKTDVMKLIFVGRLFDKKGVHILIEAISLLRDNVKVKVSIVGNGPKKDDYEALAEKLGVSDKIDFLGARNDVPELLKSADYFVHPAVWNEGFGITIVESMAAGVPCIVFKKGALPEIVTDEENGYIVAQDTAVNLAKKIEVCYEEYRTEKHKNMSMAAKVRASEFSIANMLRGLEGQINEVCNR